MTNRAPTELMPQLSDECNVFCLYLTGRPASVSVQEAYSAAHHSDARYQRASSFDRILLGIAGKSPFLAQCVDSYACLAARSSLFRKKLVLLVAILESLPPDHGFDDQISDTSAGRVMGRMVWRGCLFSLRLVPSALVLAPLHFLTAIRKGWGTKG